MIIDGAANSRSAVVDARSAPTNRASALTRPPRAELCPRLTHLFVLPQRHRIGSLEWRSVLRFVVHQQSERGGERLRWRERMKPASYDRHRPGQAFRPSDPRIGWGIDVVTRSDPGIGQWYGQDCRERSGDRSSIGRPGSERTEDMVRLWTSLLGAIRGLLEHSNS
jgi:hypothetical protein